MAKLWFLNKLQAALTSGSSDSLEYQVAMGEALMINGIRQKSTGAFNITDIRDSFGNHYTQASASNPINHDTFADVADAFNGYMKIDPPIFIAGGATIFFDVVDTSAANNTVQLMLECTKLTGGDAAQR